MCCHLTLGHLFIHISAFYVHLLQDCPLEGGRLQTARRGAEAHQRANPERKRSTSTRRRPHSEKYMHLTNSCWSELAKPVYCSPDIFISSQSLVGVNPLCFPSLVVSAQPQQPPGSLWLTKYYSHDRL